MLNYKLNYYNWTQARVWLAAHYKKKFSWNDCLCAIQSSSYNHLNQMHLFVRQYNVILLKSTSFPLRSFRSSFIQLKWNCTILQWLFSVLIPVKPGNSHFQDIPQESSELIDGRLGSRISCPASKNWEWCWEQPQAREKDSGFNPCFFHVTMTIITPVAKVTLLCQVVNKHSTSLLTICVNL